MNEIEIEEELSKTLSEINHLMEIGEMDNLSTLLMVDGCIRTSTGRYINFTDINPNDICVEDIAHALSMQCSVSTIKLISRGVSYVEIYNKFMERYGELTG